MKTSRPNLRVLHPLDRWQGMEYDRRYWRSFDAPLGSYPYSPKLEVVERCLNFTLAIVAGLLLWYGGLTLLIWCCL